MKLSFLAAILLLPASVTAAPYANLVRTALQSVMRERASGPDLAVLIASMTGAQKAEARGRLDALDRRALDGAQLRELERAYRLLDGETPALPGASLARAATRALEGGHYEAAAGLAARALKAEPGNREALTALHFAEGRATAAAAAKPPASAAAPAASPAPALRSDPTLPASSLPRSFRRAAEAPPSSTALDPKAADYWDRQLLAPLLKRSDANAAAREYLSPLLRANKVTIRLERVGDDHELSGVWGYFDLESSVIHYNLDAINDDIRQYDAFYAKADPSRVVRPISPAVPLDAAQIEHVAGRFLPLAVHEAGGHSTHSADLKRLLGSINAPINQDTELMAWRLEAAAIALERRRDPRYLTEPTQWAKEESGWLVAWENARRRGDPNAVRHHLEAMGPYKNLVHIGGDPAATQRRYSDSVTMVQSACKKNYDARCGAAISRLATLFPPLEQSSLEKAREHLEHRPGDDAVRAQVMDILLKISVARSRLDPKGIDVVSSYYRGQEKRVQELEGLAYPLTIWQKLKAAWHD